LSKRCSPVHWFASANSIIIYYFYKDAAAQSTVLPLLYDLFLYMDAEPYLIYEFIEQTLQPGPPVCLKCSCRGSPTPQITWLKNGLSLPPSER
jgi:hypothetical protein